MKLERAIRIMMEFARCNRDARSTRFETLGASEEVALNVVIAAAERDLDRRGKDGRYAD